MAEAVSSVAEAEEAARVICALRFADLGGRPPAWRKPLPDPDPPPEALEAASAAPAPAPPREVPRWPHAARGKRSRRPSAEGIRRAPRDPSSSAEAEAAAAAAARVKRMRASPASPLDYSGGSAASTSGAGAGADEGSTSSGDGRVGPTTATNNKVGMIACQPLIRRFQTPTAKNPRPGKKKALPDLQKEVRSLVEENEMLHKEAEDLHRACAAASAENRTLQLRLDQRNAPIRSDSRAPRAKQEPDSPPRLVKCDDGEGGGFRIPDLNLPASDDL